MKKPVEYQIAVNMIPFIGLTVRNNEIILTLQEIEKKMENNWIQTE
jgi:hypothetical protein